MNNYFNPNAAIIIYNYIDRQGDYDLTEQTRDEIEEIILESEITSIQTQKSKSQPSGTFSFSLAPTKNWVTVLTPGSWLSIHMSNKKLKREEKNKGGILSYGSKTLKMIGRIDSVQVAVIVNQETGARETSFTVSGRDWGQVFESMIYMDPMASVSGDDGMGLAVRAGFDKLLVDTNKNNFSTTSLINFFVDLWGSQTNSAKFKDSVRSLAGDKLNPNRLLPESVFYLPKELHERFFFQGLQFGPNKPPTVAHNINIVPGKLQSYDDYTDPGESGGVPNVGAIVGGNSLWQVLNAHCCSVVNELLTDLRWDQNRVMFTLYKRIRPFVLDKEESTVNGKNVSSSFFYIRKTEINSDQVMSIQAGTNWRDKINFLEVLPQVGHLAPGLDGITPMTKSNQSNAADYVSFGRDGFRPMLFSTPFFPYVGGKPAPLDGMYEWAPVLKKWYFNTHKMLNGVVIISNQEDYIGVGENIALEGSLFAASFHIAGDTTKGKDIKVLAHVESVTNAFSVSDYGARNFTTSVSFVRGVFTDKDCKELSNPDSYGIDSKASSLEDEAEKITNVYEVKDEQYNK